MVRKSPSVQLIFIDLRFIHQKTEQASNPEQSISRVKTKKKHGQ